MYMYLTVFFITNHQDKSTEQQQVLNYIHIVCVYICLKNKYVKAYQPKRKSLAAI